jgi:hypothetical protein
MTYIARTGRSMINECMLWVRTRSDYVPLFSILDGFRRDYKRRHWIDRKVMEMDNSDIRIDSGQIRKGVEILLKMSHNTLTSAGEHIQ